MAATKMMMMAINSMAKPPTTPKATAKMVGGDAEVGVVEVVVRVEEEVGGMTVVELSVGGMTVVELSVVELSVVVGVESVDAAAAR